MNDSYIARNIEGILKEVITMFPAIALTGIRQSGKSTLLKNVLTDYKYISFDDPILRESAVKDPNLFLDSAGDRVILDEIQYVPELLSYLKIRIDNERGYKGRFVLTGSQQFTMIKNLSDSLAGRIGLLDLHPFCMEEKRKIPFLQGKLADTLECFIHSCLYGSFPEPCVDNTIKPSLWYSAYAQTYLERDVRTLHNVGSLRDFQRFMQILASRTSQMLNLSNLANEIGVSVGAVKNWLSVLEASRVIYLLPPYYNNFGKRLTKSPKIYFLDCGLVCFLTGIHDREHILKGPLSGALFESFCMQETIKVFSNRGKRPPLYYLRTNNNLEVDLLIEENAITLFPIEIKLSKTPRSAMASGIERFMSLFPKLDIQKGRLLTLSEENMAVTRNVSTEKFDDYISWLGTL